MGTRLPALSQLEIEEYVERSRPRWLEELTTFIGFPSISGPDGRTEDLIACAEWLAAHLQSIGLANVRLIATSGNPIVYADWLGADPGAPTALLYGHYDVQPPGSLEEWETPPFEPVSRGG